MEKIKREQTHDFKAKVQRILYTESNKSSSDDDSQALLDQRRPITEHSELDNGVELLHRHEEFITKQLDTVRKLQQKGILAVSSKRRLVEHDVFEEEHPSGKGLSSRNTL